MAFLPNHLISLSQMQVLTLQMIFTHQQEIKSVGAQVSKESSKLISEKVTLFGPHGWESSFTGFTI